MKDENGEQKKKWRRRRGKVGEIEPAEYLVTKVQSEVVTMMYA